MKLNGINENGLQRIARGIDLSDGEAIDREVQDYEQGLHEERSEQNAIDDDLADREQQERVRNELPLLEDREINYNEIVDYMQNKMSPDAVDELFRMMRKNPAKAAHLLKIAILRDAT